MTLILNLHENHKGILDYRCMTIWINKIRKSNYKSKQIRRLMGILGSSSSIRCKRKSCTQKSHVNLEENNSITIF
jgi:putative transposase